MTPAEKQNLFRRFANFVVKNPGVSVYDVFYHFLNFSGLRTEEKAFVQSLFPLFLATGENLRSTDPELLQSVFGGMG